MYFELDDSDDPDAQLERTAAALTRHGLTGTISPHHLDEVDWVPSVDDLLELRVRVRGRRALVDGLYVWEPDMAAVRRSLDAADEWRLSAPEPLTAYVRRGMIGPTTMPARVHLAELGDLQPGAGGSHCVYSGGATDQRAVTRYHAGVVAVVHRGQAVRQSWQSVLDNLRTLLTDHADLVVYACVTRSRGVADRSTLFVPTPWPSRTGVRRSRGAAFEDVLAPDAYGMQLLGSATFDRVPRHPDWEATPTQGEGVLVAHRHPERWFSDDFPGHTTLMDPDATDVPPIVAEARAQLAPALYTPEALDEFLKNPPSARSG